MQQRQGKRRQRLVATILSFVTISLTILAALPSHASGAGSPDNLISAGGSVIRLPTTYVIYWLPSGITFEPGGSDSSYESLIQRYLSDVGGSSFYNIVTQYTDSGGAASDGSLYGGSYVDTTPYPAAGTQQQPLHDADLQAAVSRAIAAKGWSTGLNSIFYVFTGNGIQSCDDASFSQCSFDTYCAYHSMFTQGGQPVYYAVLPDPAQNGGACLATDGAGNHYAPNGDATADSAVSLVSKEQFALVTDPQGDGWTDSTGAEIGDKCDWSYGSVGADGSNLTLGSDKYIVQQEWSNADGACVLTYGTPAATPGVSPTPTPTSTPLPSTRLTPTPTPSSSQPTPTPTPASGRTNRLTPTPTPATGPTPTPTPVSGRNTRPGPLVYRERHADLSVSGSSLKSSKQRHRPSRHRLWQRWLPLPPVSGAPTSAPSPHS